MLFAYRALLCICIFNPPNDPPRLEVVFFLKRKRNVAGEVSDLLQSQASEDKARI